LLEVVGREAGLLADEPDDPEHADAVIAAVAARAAHHRRTLASISTRP
jgi:hypothetical protein